MPVPWTKIKTEWLKGGKTHQQLADKYGVKVKTIQNRAYKEGWGKQKGKIKEKVEEQTRERVVRARVNHLEKLIEANESLLDALVKLAAEVSDDPKMMLMDKTGSIRGAESFAKAIQTAVATQRDLYRLPTIDQKFAAKKWREQQKLEKEKMAGPQIEQEVWQIEAPEGVELDG